MYRTSCMYQTEFDTFAIYCFVFVIVKLQLILNVFQTNGCQLDEETNEC